MQKKHFRLYASLALIIPLGAFILAIILYAVPGLAQTNQPPAGQNPNPQGQVYTPVPSGQVGDPSQAPQPPMQYQPPQGYVPQVPGQAPQAPQVPASPDQYQQQQAYAPDQYQPPQGYVPQVPGQVPQVPASPDQYQQPPAYSPDQYQQPPAYTPPAADFSPQIPTSPDGTQPQDGFSSPQEGMPQEGMPMEPAPVPDPTAGNLAAELEGPSIPEDADADTIERFMKLEKWHKEVLSSYAVDVSRMDDPFMPIETVARPPETDTSRQASRNLPMIQRLALNQFTLEAIIESPIPGSTTALVVSGGVGYILHEGTKIGPNNGTVRQITSSKVIIEEPEVNYRGERTSRITEFSLNPLEGIEDILG